MYIWIITSCDLHVYVGEHCNVGESKVIVYVDVCITFIHPLHMQPHTIHITTHTYMYMYLFAVA